jgi:hypothetical protein
VLRCISIASASWLESSKFRSLRSRSFEAFGRRKFEHYVEHSGAVGGDITTSRRGQIVAVLIVSMVLIRNPRIGMARGCSKTTSDSVTSHSVPDRVDLSQA